MSKERQQTNKEFKPMDDTHTLRWPQKYDIFGVGVSATTYDEAANLIITAAQKDISASVTHLPVHGIVTTSRDPLLKSQINSFELVCPDGQPVKWTLNLIYRTKLPDRVYGPDMMLKLCCEAAKMGIGIYLYGSYKHIVEKLRSNLKRKIPSLKVLGCESPPFRPLTPQEDRAVVERIKKSGARIIFLGLGCPLQDTFAYKHKKQIKAVQVCVGAAFDFLAGNKKMAPKWMQQYGLEWLYRLMQEPGRLWRRYLLCNSLYICFLLKLLLRSIMNKTSFGDSLE